MAGLEIFGWSSVLLAAAGQNKGHLVRIPSMVVGLLLALVASVLISTIMSKGNFQNWSHFGFMRWIFLLWAWTILLPTLLSDESYFVFGIRVWLWALIGSSLYAFLQAFWGIDFLRMNKHNLVPLASMWRATGPFSISITFASVVGMSSAAAWAWTAFGPKKTRLLAGVAAGLGSVATILTLSRATSIAIVISILAIALWAWRKWFPYVFASLAACFFVTWFQFTGFRGRFQGFENLSQDHSMILRMGLWKSYWSIFVDHPWFGVGLFSPQKYLPEYYERLGVLEPFYSHAHSNLLQWLAGAGIIGCVLYLALSLLMIVNSWSLFRRGTTEMFRALGASLTMAQLVFHFDGLIECNFFDGEVNHFLIWVWGVTLAALIVDRRRNWAH